MIKLENLNTFKQLTNTKVSVAFNFRFSKMCCTLYVYIRIHTVEKANNFKYKKNDDDACLRFATCNTVEMKETVDG